VEVPGNKLKQELLLTKNVYILDSHSDLFVWVGKKSTRLVRAAALKLSSELFSMLIRPEYAMIHRVSEGTESQARFLKFLLKKVPYLVPSNGVMSSLLLASRSSKNPARDPFKESIAS
jgi:hypothetical protein